MKRPAVFFDRDNTLIANDGYLGEPDKVVLIPGAADAVARVRAMGFAAITFSNQSGVARGMFSEETVHAVNSRLDEMLQDQNPRAVIDRHEFCPFHPEAAVERYRQDSPLRKPKPGMILQAVERLGLDVSRSWVIGDAARDIEAGHAVGCRTILFTDPALTPSSAATEESTQRPDFVVSSLREAIDIIERTPVNRTQTEPTVNADPPGDSQAAVTTEQPPVPQAPVSNAASTRRPTFAERVKAGTFASARPVDGTGASTERPKRVLPATEATEISEHVRPTEPVSDVEQLEPLLREILDEVRLMRMRQPHGDFAVSKLLAGIVQVMVLPALFFAYLHRGAPQDLQSMLILAAVLQTMTISLLIMGRQS